MSDRGPEIAKERINDSGQVLEGSNVTELATVEDDSQRFDNAAVALPEISPASLEWLFHPSARRCPRGRLWAWSPWAGKAGGGVHPVSVEAAGRP